MYYECAYTLQYTWTAHCERLRTVKEARFALAEAATNSSEVRKFVTNWILRSWQPHRVTSGCFERDRQTERQTDRDRQGGKEGEI